MANHYDIPTWAGKPPTGLHLDVMKDDKLIQKLMIDTKKCYLFGRNPQMNDFCIDHASCSRVHAVLVYHKHLDRAFLVDLGSTHGTYIGSIRLEANKPTQLPIDSTFHFGASTRMYTIRERPQAAPRPIIEELEQSAEDAEGGLLGLPETETELDNLTEFNTAHNRRISMLGIPDEEIRSRKRKKRGVTFNEDEEVINPEDVDPSVGRFRNLVQSTVVPTKRQRVEGGLIGDVGSRLPGHHPSHHQILGGGMNASNLYQDLPPETHSSGPAAAGSLLSSSLASKLGIALPNPAPDVEVAPPPPPEAPKRSAVGPARPPGSEPAGPSLEPKKKKYAKEAWPGKMKPMAGLLISRRATKQNLSSVQCQYQVARRRFPRVSCRAAAAAAAVCGSQPRSQRIPSGRPSRRAEGEEFLSEPPPVAMSAAHETPNCTSASIKDTETWEKNKKFTVYKVAVSRGNASWFIFRRYNEFSKLCEVAKKQAPHLLLKMPGKKLFGSNMEPKLVEARREALDDFIQKVTSDERLMHTREVIEFFQLDQKHVENCVKTEDTQSTDDCDSGKGSYKGSNSSGASTELENKPPSPVNLGHTERRHVKPSHFEFLKVIGKGSFGKVLLARHKEEEKFYAIKVLQKTLIVKRNETKHIMSERNVLLQNIKHPFLVGLHYSFQTTDKLYFVLDYINGGELFFHLQKERSFSESRARFYSAEISSALGYLHSRQIIYRDLKPENLLLDQQGHVILTDFGLCKEGLRDSDTTDTFCGTPEYLAPEVIRKQAYDRSVDWWCLGAVLYEMLYGLPPFYNKNTSTMYQNILYKPLKLRPTVSENARNILDKLLQKESQNRLGSGKNDVLDIQKHPFYKNINWDDLINKKIPPPFNPNVNGSMDLKNIDPEFTKEPVPASVGRSQNGTVLSASVLEADAAFEGFSYAPPLEDFF
ncbi:Hypothetical predicted protein [Cloeon dipterum]|uniref:Nuclear inhibitor of protein phosphatase 1 n=1 Tax=Cloeon dipterum TaxID=197152 RepID=A0A8S1C9G4_9INSE|nr:Hypothetical predicted protein [Cloeon dipterum]